MDQVDSPVIEYTLGTHNTQKVKEAYFCILSSEFSSIDFGPCGFMLFFFFSLLRSIFVGLGDSSILLSPKVGLSVSSVFFLLQSLDLDPFFRVCEPIKEKLVISLPKGTCIILWGNTRWQKIFRFQETGLWSRISGRSLGPWKLEWHLSESVCPA